MSRYDDLPPVPTIPLHVPGDDLPLRFVTHEVVTKDHRDEPWWGYGDEYIAIRCPECGHTIHEHGFERRHAWMGYEHHVHGRHIGTKWATITVEGTADYGRERRAAGKHFRRHVGDRIDLLDFTLRESDGYRQAYTATFEAGRWRGDVENRQLSGLINDKVDFDAFDSVDIDWHHRVPTDPIVESERVERGTYDVKQAVTDGGGPS